MIGNIDRNSPALAEIFDTRTAWYIDYNGNKSLENLANLKYISAAAGVAGKLQILPEY